MAKLVLAVVLVVLCYFLGSNAGFLKQTSYGQGGVCSQAPTAYTYTTTGVCIPNPYQQSTKGLPYALIFINTTTGNVYWEGHVVSTCTDAGQSIANAPLNTCYSTTNNGVSEWVTVSSADTIDFVPINNTLTTYYYLNVTCTSDTIYSTVFTLPNACAVSGGQGATIGCDATHEILSSYGNLQCTGSATSSRTSLNPQCLQTTNSNWYTRLICSSSTPTSPPATPPPTPAPTLAPTPPPTPAPTPAPTLAPTPAPTTSTPSTSGSTSSSSTSAASTTAPTPSPSNAPSTTTPSSSSTTATPSSSTTTPPSSAPTRSPTIQPTQIPTEQPAASSDSPSLHSFSLFFSSFVIVVAGLELL